LDEFANRSLQTVPVAEEPASPTNKTVIGAVAGAGYQFRGGRHARFTPQIRFTRWTKPTFDSGFARSQRNQIEFLIGITL